MANFDDFKKKFVIDSSKTMAQNVVELPSGMGKATIRPMKVKEQREFLKALEKKDEFLVNEAFDNILTSCVDTLNGESFNVESICSQDRTYLLIEIRKLTSGNEATISHVCPVTQKIVNGIKINLNDLIVEKFQGKSLSTELELASDTKLKLGPINRKNEKEMEKWIKTNSKESMIDRRYCAYAGIIKGILSKNEAGEFEEVLLNDGKPLGFNHLLDFVVKYCSPNDLQKIDEYIKTLDFGIKLRFHFKTDDYENENEEISIINFFIT